MIIFEESKNKNTAISEENLKKRYVEFMDMADNWKENFLGFPENMLFCYILFLRDRKKEKNNITFFDIGAAEGIYTYQTLKEFDEGKIFCFEPEQERYKVLAKNILEYLENNKKDIDINVIQKIVNDGIEKKEFLRHYEDINTGEGSASSSIIVSHHLNTKIIEVEYEAICLDDFLYLDFVDVVKIDVEGAEIKVLNGGIKFLQKFKPIIFLEIHKDPMYGGITLDMVKEFFNINNFNYKINDIESKHHLEYVYIEIK